MPHCLSFLLSADFCLSTWCLDIGVSQNSVLGLPLFSVYIHSLCYLMLSHCFRYHLHTNSSFSFHSGSFLWTSDWCIQPGTWCISLDVSDLLSKLNSLSYPLNPLLWWTPSLSSGSSIFPIAQNNNSSKPLLFRSYPVPSITWYLVWVTFKIQPGHLHGHQPDASLRCLSPRLLCGLPPFAFALKAWSQLGVQGDPEKPISSPFITLQTLLISLRVKSKVLKMTDRALLHLVSRPGLNSSPTHPAPCALTPLQSHWLPCSSPFLEFCPLDIYMADFPNSFGSSPQYNFFGRDVIDHST